MSEHYTHTFVCEGCVHANFHSCCGNFCSCDQDKEDGVSLTEGECEFKDTNTGRAENDRYR